MAKWKSGTKSIKAIPNARKKLPIPPNNTPIKIETATEGVISFL